MEDGRKLNATQVKMFALICMFIDHFAASVLYYYMKKNGYSSFSESTDLYHTLFFCFYSTCRAIGRVAFPVYAYMIVQGFEHTRSRLKYLLRLILLAVISEVPFDLALHGKIVNWNYQNVFVTLALGLICIWLIDLVYIKLEKKSKIAATITAILIWGAFFTFGYLARCDYVNTGVSCITGIYMWQKNKRKTAIFVVTAITFLANLWLIPLRRPKYDRNTIYFTLIILAVFVVWAYLQRLDRVGALLFAAAILSSTNTSEIYSCLGAILIIPYDGTRGKCSKVLKWAFYFFYPVHLLLLYILVKNLKLV